MNEPTALDSQLVVDTHDLAGPATPGLGATARWAALTMVAVPLAGDHRVIAALGVAACFAVAVAWLDLRHGRLPDAGVALVAWPAVVAAAAAAVDGDRARALGVLAGAAMAGAPVLALHLLSPAAMGFGDVKLAVAIGAVLGLLDPVMALAAVAAGSGATAIVGGLRRRGAVPFGPGLVGGAVVVTVLMAVLRREAVPWH